MKRAQGLIEIFQQFVILMGLMPKKPFTNKHDKEEGKEIDKNFFPLLLFQ